ncbi:MAG: Ig-like domain-containing protein, partial [Gemmatimonadales bacterium]
MGLPLQPGGRPFRSRPRPARGFAAVVLSIATIALSACESEQAISPPAGTPVAAVEVAPRSVALVPGGSLQLQARLSGFGGRALPGGSVTWSSSDERVATVSAAGIVTAVGVGRATIRAAIDGVSAPATVEVVPLAAGSTIPNLQVAFIGDQGGNSNSIAVLQLIRNEGADLVLHQGDFDYGSNPTAWDNNITSVLGADFPYFASVGNHDTGAWSGSSGYQAKLQARLNRVAALVPGTSCTGDLGVNSACYFQGLFFILTGPGTLGSGHEA